MRACTERERGRDAVWRRPTRRDRRAPSCGRARRHHLSLSPPALPPTPCILPCQAKPRRLSDPSLQCDFLPNPHARTICTARLLASIRARLSVSENTEPPLLSSTLPCTPRSFCNFLAKKKKGGSLRNYTKLNSSHPSTPPATIYYYLTVITSSTKKKHASCHFINVHTAIWHSDHWSTTKGNMRHLPFQTCRCRRPPSKQLKHHPAAEEMSE